MAHPHRNATALFFQLFSSLSSVIILTPVKAHSVAVEREMAVETWACVTGGNVQGAAFGGVKTGNSKNWPLPASDELAFVGLLQNALVR